MALVVFLRGINVGGRRRFRPTELAAELKRFGVINIGSTGTFIVRNPPSRKQLIDAISRRIPAGTDVILCRDREILEIASTDAFAKILSQSDITKFVSVLNGTPRKGVSLPIRFPSTGKWLLKILDRRKRFVFGIYRRDMKVIGYLGKLDEIFGVRATTRSWKTMMTIMKLLET